MMALGPGLRYDRPPDLRVACHPGRSRWGAVRGFEAHEKDASAHEGQPLAALIF